MSQRIVVVNPNSTRAVTEGMDRALDSLRSPDGPTIDCVTLAEGPPGIESDQHVTDVVQPLCRLVKREEAEADAFVDACFSDPGLAELRRATRKPVFGIGESGILTALSMGYRFGTIAMLEASVPRQTRYVRALGFEGRLAGIVPVGLRMAEVVDETKAFERLVEAGRQLKRMGADVLILGCAGMARYRERLEERLVAPVIDPVQAAAGMAITAVKLGYRGRRVA